MNHLTFTEKDAYSVAVLIKESALKLEIKEHYPIDWNNSIALSLSYKDKTTVKDIKADLSNIIKACKHLQVKTLLVCDTAYFKVLTKLSKAEPHYGSVIHTNDFDIILAPNYQALFYNPNIQSKIDLAVTALLNHVQGTHVALGTGIIHYEAYPSTIDEISEWLIELLQEPVLTCDIETTSLNVMQAKLVSISFAWSKHEGIAFEITPENKKILKQFFIDFQGHLIYHNGTYDISVLCAELFMKDLL